MDFFSIAFPLLSFPSQLRSCPYFSAAPRRHILPFLRISSLCFTFSLRISAAPCLAITLPSISRQLHAKALSDIAHASLNNAYLCHRQAFLGNTTLRPCHAYLLRSQTAHVPAATRLLTAMPTLNNAPLCQSNAHLFQCPSLLLLASFSFYCA